MSITHTVGMSWVSSNTGTGLSRLMEYTSGDAEIAADVSVSTGQTDYLVNVAFDKDDLKAIYITSDKAVTLETNSGSSPGNTFSLLANKPLVWTSDSYFSNPFSVDVTKLYFTNASGATATIYIRVLVDSTP